MPRPWQLLRRGRPSSGGGRGSTGQLPAGGALLLPDTEEVVRPLLKIQRAMRSWLEGRQRRGRIRCHMGHPLKLEVQQDSWEAGCSSAQATSLTMKLELQVCERCCKVIRSPECWSCRECDYHACSECVQELMRLDQGMGRQDAPGGAPRVAKPGVSLYWLKYALSLVLLVYGIVVSKSIFTQEDKNFSEAIQASTVSVTLLLLLVLHLSVLICDRILHKSYYRCCKQPTSLKILDCASVAILVAEFLWVHVHVIRQLANVANPREATIQLHQDGQLCTYYVGWMLYLGVCVAQRKHGLPAVDHDMLRTSASPESQGVWVEKLHVFYWYLHYFLPFVDDLRVIIDWTVMPTSLDLWMHFKVEDAHSWLFRTRHVMFVRRQSFFAEPRDTCEKIYSGWLVLLLLVFIILMPIIVFSPITPFPNSVLVTSGEASLRLAVASSCSGLEHPDSRSCRLLEVPLYRAAATQLVEYNRSRELRYFEQHPRASTAIDIQEVAWPPESHVPLQVSPEVGAEVSRLLGAGAGSPGSATMAIFELRLAMARGSSVADFGTRRHACFCAPAALCGPGGPAWPPGVEADCGGAWHGEEAFGRVARWWAALRAGAGGALRVEGLWAPALHVGTGEPVLKSPPQDVEIALANCSGACGGDPPAAGCPLSSCWGRLGVGGGRVPYAVYELERSAMLSPIAGANTSYSVIGLYIAVVLVAGRYLRVAFQDSSKRAIYEEIPDVGVFLDLVTGVKLARDHRDLRTEFQLYYCLMKVLRSTNLLLSNGGHEPVDYGVCRHDVCPPECKEPIHSDHHISPARSSAPLGMGCTEVLAR